ncbi:hypothetical protein vseg_003358 [Gypsophila vaccaria]
MQDYTISSGYQWLLGDHAVVGWDKLIWCRYNQPKHAFLGWLSIQDRLLTKDRLLKMGIVHEATCLLCQEQEESTAHLFFHCPYSRYCVERMQNWLEAKVPDLQDWNSLLLAHRGSKLQRQVLMACVLALCHSIWAIRSTCRMEAKVLLPEALVAQIKISLKVWLVHKCYGLHAKDLKWLKKKLNIDIYI